MTSDSNHRLLVVARALACLAGFIALLAIVGYVTGTPSLVRLVPGFQAMSPLTSLMIIFLTIAGLASSWRRERLMVAVAASVCLLALLLLGLHAALGADTLSPKVAGILFGVGPEHVGRTSTATALSAVLIGVSLLFRRRAPFASDISGGIALLISGTALLGYLYGVTELYALPVFNSMALNTACALFLLAGTSLTTEPELGWSSVLGSNEMGGGATRRQLAFIAVPVVAGWGFLALANSLKIGPAIAMALLVIVTIVPLALLILRDGRVLNELDRERRDKVVIQEDQSREMALRLAEQAEALAREGEERAKVEATIYRTQRMEAVGQLTGGIAHDFNNLLMAIRGNLELIQLRLPPGEDRLHRYLSNATAATDKGAKVTGQLLAFSRSQRLDIRSIQVDRALHGARDLIGTSLGPNIEIVVDIDTVGAWVTSDDAQLELAILNLAVNARDAMADGGRVTIQSRACATRLSGEHDDTDYVAIRVIDTGSGMTEEVAAQAVEPFFTTKERGKGTGLGLAQVYGFVRQCGGDLRIVSQPGSGTSVEMLLRCSDPVALPSQDDKIATSGDEDARIGKRVVVIDDDDGVRAVIVDALVSAGFEVVEASGGEAGLALMRGDRPSAAVIDFLMPGMNGAEVAKRAQTLYPDLPIVFVSGYSDTVALDGIAGAVVLRKPFDIKGLSRALDSVLH